MNQDLEYYNVYCDESSYTNPLQQYFLISALILPRNQKEFIHKRLKKVKNKFGFMPELKWQNLTVTKIPYLNELLQVFFTSEMDFRTIIIDKSKLEKHGRQPVSELSFYKFYYLLLRGILREDQGYYVYLDQRNKSIPHALPKLKSYLIRHLEGINLENNGDFDLKLEEVESQNSLFVQVCDLFQGAVGYYWNGLRASEAKMKFIRNLSERLGKKDLHFSSQLYDKKWNQFLWTPADEIVKYKSKED